VQTTGASSSPVPAAIPEITANITNAVSRVSSTTVRNRMIASAPARLNARARLSAITIITSAIRTGQQHERDGQRPPLVVARPLGPAVKWWTAVTTHPIANATPNRAGHHADGSGGAVVAAGFWMSCSNDSSISRHPRRRGGTRRAAGRSPGSSPPASPTNRPRQRRRAAGCVPSQIPHSSTHRRYFDARA
jgi:hypothetical protein